jgi:hypothetical protein
LAALRNRENQRRSRARRKDYIQELEQRIRAYEVAGVRATAEVQAAARKVAEENTNLRSLLSMCGVDDRRTEEFLRTGNASFVVTENAGCDLKTTFGKEASLTEKANVAMQDCAAAYLRPPSATGTAIRKTVAQYSIAEAPQIATAVSLNSLPQVPAVSHHYTSFENMDRTPPPNSSDISIHAARSSPTLAPIDLDEPFSDQNGQDRVHSFGARDEISCLDAAEIIAGMRGHDDPEEVWPELGCNSSGTCMVKNIAMFQIMDQ